MASVWGSHRELHALALSRLGLDSCADASVSSKYDADTGLCVATEFVICRCHPRDIKRAIVAIAVACTVFMIWFVTRKNKTTRYENTL